MLAVDQKQLLVSLLAQGPKRVFPLSLAEQRLWFLDQLVPGNPAYNVPFGLRLQGNLNLDALELSFWELIRRHEILRARFEADAGRPVQVVGDSIIEMPVINLTGKGRAKIQQEAYRIAMEEAQTSFNLATGPLLRLKLIRLAEDEHILICVAHHIVFDGWSLEILVRDLAALYHQHSGGPPAALACLPIQYGDYAKWQREWLAGDLLASQAQYWKQKLAGAPALLRLPSDYVRPPEQTYEGASQVISVPKELVRVLADFGRKRRATLFMVMLAIFKTLLHSYTGSDDILVGVPVAGRNSIELEDLVGFFVNTLVLRTDLSGNPQFSDLLLREREVALDAFAHADLPFEKLVESLNPVRSLSYGPVVQVMFSVVRAKKLPKFGDVSASPYIFNSRTSFFDLSMEFIEDAENQCWLRAEYTTSLFGHTRMAKLLDDYLTLLKGVAAQPELRISGLTSLLKQDAAATACSMQSPGYLEAGNAALPPLERPDSHLAKHVEPHDPLEQILVRIWEQVLGASGIGVRDNFFDLGGHSLLAARLVSEVEKAVGRNVPLSALFRGSTIESLAEIIRQRANWTPDPLVTEINAGKRGFPLFAIVQPGIDALGYAIMARHLGAEQSFYKLQAHGPSCHIVPYTIEEFRTIAREYIAAMRAIQPKGPYFLLGMCNGVHIAEQMVLELEAQGQEVGFLGVIDTFVRQHSQIRWLVYLDSFLKGRRNVSRLPFLAQVSHYRRALKNRFRRVLLHETEPLSPWTDVVWPGKEFQPRQFRAPVILFKGPRHPYFMVKDNEMCWGGRTLSGVEVHMVDASHEEMLREPAVQVIAEQLKGALHRLEKRQIFARVG